MVELASQLLGLAEKWTHVHCTGGISHFAKISKNMLTDHWSLTSDHNTGHLAMHFSIIEGHSQALNGERLCGIRFCGGALNMASDLWGCPAVLKGVFKCDTPTTSDARSWTPPQNLDCVCDDSNLHRFLLRGQHDWSDCSQSLCVCVFVCVFVCLGRSC